MICLLTGNSGLAWHTEEATLRQKFEEFGLVDEAVCCAPDIALQARPDSSKACVARRTSHHLY